MAMSMFLLGRNVTHKINVKTDLTFSSTNMHIDRDWTHLNNNEQEPPRVRKYISKICRLCLYPTPIVWVSTVSGSRERSVLYQFPVAGAYQPIPKLRSPVMYKVGPTASDFTTYQ